MKFVEKLELRKTNKILVFLRVIATKFRMQMRISTPSNPAKPDGVLPTGCAAATW